MSGELPGADPGGAHEDFEAQAVAWALSTLEPEEAATFVAHLRGCARCARVVEETRLVMDHMARAVPAVPPPADLRARVGAAVRATGQDPQPGQAGPRAAQRLQRRGRSGDRPGRRAVGAVLLAAVAAAVVGFGVGAVVLGRSSDEAAIEALVDLGPATVTPVVDAEDREVATVVAGTDDVRVVTHGVPVNDAADTTYVLWGLGDGEPRALGTFDVTAPEPELRTVADGAGGGAFTGYGISLEPGREAPPAPTDVVAAGDVAS